MTGKSKSRHCAKLCAQIHNEASEKWLMLERKRLRAIFAALGSVDPSTSLCFQYDEFSTLEAIRKQVETGDRKAMVALLFTVTSALQAFEVLPADVRAALAAGLENMRRLLEESNNFLPRKRGRPMAEKPPDMLVTAGVETALQVEFLRLNQRCKLLEAKERVAEEFGLTESLVNKRWKLNHKEAKILLQAIIDVQLAVAATPSSKKVPN